MSISVSFDILGVVEPINSCRSTRSCSIFTLFEVNNACNSKNEIVGLVNNNVIGSFIHLIDKI